MARIWLQYPRLRATVADFSPLAGKNVLAVAHGRRERVAGPLRQRPGRDDIGVAGKAYHRPGCAPARPEIVDMAEAHTLDGKAEPFQALDQDFLAAGVIRGERAASDESLGQIQGVVGGH